MDNTISLGCLTRTPYPKKVPKPVKEIRGLSSQLWHSNIPISFHSCFIFSPELAYCLSLHL